MQKGGKLESYGSESKLNTKYSKLSTIEETNEKAVIRTKQVMSQTVQGLENPFVRKGTRWADTVIERTHSEKKKLEPLAIATTTTTYFFPQPKEKFSPPAK